MKKKEYLNIIWFFLWFISIFLGINLCAAENPHQEAQMIIDITAWPLTIWISGNTLKLNWTGWSIITWKFDTGTFWVDDQNWSTKYWTTISATDLVYESGDIKKVISNQNIQIKKWDEGLTRLHWSQWIENELVGINPALDSFQSLDKPIKYFTSDWAGTPNWKLCKYGNAPEIQIDLSDWDFSWCTTNFPCTYKWTLTYTLYEIE